MSTKSSAGAGMVVASGAAVAGAPVRKRRVKVGGRTKGTMSKAKRALLTMQRIAASKGLSPLDYLLEVMRDASESTELRLIAAKSAAPYLHRKQPTEIIGSGGFQSATPAEIALAIREQLSALGATADP